jgi:hypothetical protein
VDLYFLCGVIMGFDAIQTEVIARLGNRGDIAARSVTWINDAYFEILMNPRFTFFELDSAQIAATTIGQRTYSLPADLWFILSLRDNTNNIKLQRTHTMVLDKIAPTSGQPVRYARFGLAVELDPTPNGVFTLQLRYRKRVTELAPGGSMIIPREWDEPVTVLAVVKGFEALDNKEKAAFQRQLFDKMLENRQDVPTLEDMDAETTIGINEGFSVGARLP